MDNKKVIAPSFTPRQRAEIAQVAMWCVYGAIGAVALDELEEGSDEYRDTVQVFKDKVKELWNAEFLEECEKALSD